MQVFRRWFAGLMGLTVGLVLGGCPTGGVSGDAVQARIVISATTGPAPLRVQVTGIDSTADGASIAKYNWDFAGQASSSSISALHTFETAGRFRITLTVTDDRGRSDSDVIEVRATGGSATAVASAEPTSGAAPLVVRFDGTGSTATEGGIADYFWDFGDGGTSRSATPSHVYERSGAYTATLRVVSGGGAESTAEVEIDVDPGAGGGSLQFDGDQVATLPLDVSEPLEQFTFETAFKGDGGVLVSFGTPTVSVDVSSADGVARLRFGAETFEGNATISAGEWGTVTLTYDGAAVTLFIDGQAVIEAAVTGTVEVDSLALGSGFDGKLANVRFWSAAVEPGGEDDDALLGDWPLSDGSGQNLVNIVGGASGVRGLSQASESRDPAWSSDGP